MAVPHLNISSSLVLLDKILAFASSRCPASFSNQGGEGVPPISKCHLAPSAKGFLTSEWHEIHCAD